MKENMSKSIILGYLVDYLKLKKIPMNKSGKVLMIQCPFCQAEPMTANRMPNTNTIKCFPCDKKYNIIDIARHLDYDEKKPGDDETVLQHIKKVLKIKVITKTDEKNIINFLDKYEKWGFDCVPIVNNGKIPIEKSWPTKEHKYKKEWTEWLSNGLNIGIKTGKRSNVTIIDIDTKPIPPEIDNIKGNCLIQESTKGFHLIYEYDPEFPKTRIDSLKVDIENDGGQVVIFPSTIDKVQRKFINIPKGITQIPVELKKFLLSKITVPRKTESEKIREDISNEDFSIPILGEGQRNSSLLRLGGIFRKDLNINQTRNVLYTLNRTICNPPLPYKEINILIGSLDKYYKGDEKELTHRILEHLKETGEMSRTEMAMTIVGTNRGEAKKRVDKALAYLVKEEYITKKGMRYKIIKKVEWKESLIEVSKPIDFKMPYFYDVANFNWGDLILIGSKNKAGKTHISQNIIKQLVNQGINPYYISLETGSRFTKIAMQLGLKEGDFKWDFRADPTSIELEKNSITIIDWLCPNIIEEGYAGTNKLFMRFAEQLYKTGGILIVFVQLKEDNTWFAPNMIKQFPALATRYIYDKDNNGIYGTFKIDVIREAKLQIKTYEIPCKYFWDSKLLVRVDELGKEISDEKKKGKETK